MATTDHLRQPSLTPDVQHPSETAVFALAVLVWGPVDMLLTAAAWQLEANPVTLALGLWPWLAVKIGLVVLLVHVYRLTRGWESKRELVTAWVMTLATVGAVLIGLNVAVVTGAIA